MQKTGGYDFLFSHGHIISSTYSPTNYNNHNYINGTDWLMHDSNMPLVMTQSGGAILNSKHGLPVLYNQKR
jgi:hypothetical protein